MAKQTAFIILAFSAVAALFSCNQENGSSKEPTSIIDSLKMLQDTVKSKPTAKVEMVISDIPFPFEILDNLKKSNVAFDAQSMNASSNVNKYNKYNSKALSLGVYGADLAYVVTNEQFQQIGAYVKNAKRLADDLNIPFAFNQDMMDQYNKFKENKDSLTRVVYESYNKVDRSLKGDQRVGIAALVVTGSWLEGLYLSTSTFVKAEKNEQNKGLYKTIYGQKMSLGIVIKLLSDYKSEAYFADLIKELKEITSAYDKVSSNDAVNEQELKTINERVAKLRNRIVEGI